MRDGQSEQKPSDEDSDSGEEGSEDAAGSESWLDLICCTLVAGQGRHGDDVVKG